MHHRDPLEGALLVDKPAGPTSHDVVETLRRHFQIRKVGHCGTLDPKATGLLILLLGRATKLAEKLIADDKVYAGSIRFGVATASYDADGEIVSSLPVPPLSLDQLNQVATTFTGDLLQIPPMVSAIKKEGVPLYKLARRGVEVERKPRLVHVYHFRFSAYQEPLGCFRIACTKGTYVRSIAHEVGQKIGCGAHLHNLRRLVAGKYDVKDAIPFEDIVRLSSTELEQRLIPTLQLAD